MKNKPARYDNRRDPQGAAIPQQHPVQTSPDTRYGLFSLLSFGIYQASLSFTYSNDINCYLIIINFVNQTVTY